MNCKPGDLAYLSNDCVDAGAVVEVLTAGPLGIYGPTWHCKTRTPIQCEREISKRQVLTADFYVSDCFLRPITGPSLENEARDELKVKEPA
jgi:hypothetical protein